MFITGSHEHSINIGRKSYQNRLSISGDRTMGIPVSVERVAGRMIEEVTAFFVRMLIFIAPLAAVAVFAGR